MVLHTSQLCLLLGFGIRIGMDWIGLNTMILLGWPMQIKLHSPFRQQDDQLAAGFGLGLWYWEISLLSGRGSSETSIQFSSCPSLGNLDDPGSFLEVFWKSKRCLSVPNFGSSVQLQTKAVVIVSMPVPFTSFHNINHLCVHIDVIQCYTFSLTFPELPRILTWFTWNVFEPRAINQHQPASTSIFQQSRQAEIYHQFHDDFMPGGNYPQSYNALLGLVIPRSHESRSAGHLEKDS